MRCENIQFLYIICTHLAPRKCKANAKWQPVKPKGCLFGASGPHLLPIWQARGAKTSATAEQTQHFCSAQNNWFLYGFVYIYRPGCPRLTQNGHPGSTRMFSGPLSETFAVRLANTGCDKRRHDTTKASFVRSAGTSCFNMFFVHI